MLFNVPHMAALAHKEAVHTVVLAVLSAAVVNTAAGNNQNITVFPDKEVIVYGFLQSALGENHRDMAALILCAVLDADIDAALVFLGRNLNIRR